MFYQVRREESPVDLPSYWQIRVQEVRLPGADTYHPLRVTLLDGLCITIEPPICGNQVGGRWQKECFMLLGSGSC